MNKIVPLQPTSLAESIKRSFATIAPYWPLKNLIAVNPLQGFENIPIEEAVKIGAGYFQQATIPQPMLAVNRETIKWLQAYFDDGQATITMPQRERGLYTAWRELAFYDSQLHNNNKQHHRWLRALPDTAIQAVAECLLRLGIAREDREQFLVLLLTTLPGWASYVKYRTEWDRSRYHQHPATQADYLAVRLIITSLLWPQAKQLMHWHHQAHPQVKPDFFASLQHREQAYRQPLLQQLAVQPVREPHIPEAQLVFCIDVRSEPYRRALEATGDYQTFGFAGFFGIPVQITDCITGDSYASCPVLLQPKHEITQYPHAHHECERDLRGYQRLTIIKKLYQAVKYNLTTPFALAEALGLFSGLWLGLRSLSPRFAAKLKNLASRWLYTPQQTQLRLDNITEAEQYTYARSALKMMGLTHHFAPIVVFCGHGSMTQNNAYATALDCGACGGRHGGTNARILAAILNDAQIRAQLLQDGIHIPAATHFIAAEHNTTTDEVTLYGFDRSELITKLQANLCKARQSNNLVRMKTMAKKVNPTKVISLIQRRAQDWAQVRPEWGLASNAAFIVAPRELTAALDLHGRCFLHSYDYREDPDAKLLTTILTAPMIVAHWINMQYLLSTFDNVAYGGGSKITKNITGKLGIMQGNASDLMTGLPLQSLYRSDSESYHAMQRLLTMVFAPRELVNTVVQSQAILKKLFGNGWAQIAVIEPEQRDIYLLDREGVWQALHEKNS